MTRRTRQPAIEGRLVVGLVRGLHGLRGGVRVEVLSDQPERFAPGSVLYAEGSERPLKIADVRRDGPGLIVRFEGFADRTSVESLRDSYLETEKPTELPPQTWYWHEIVGCDVVSSSGELLGTVSEVTRVGEAEVYTVKGPRGELLVPAVKSVVLDLSVPEGRIVVDPVALGLQDG